MFRSIFIVFCITVMTFSRERIRPEYDFRDSSFSLVFQFDIPRISNDDLLSILFNYEKVREYSEKTNVKISLIEENEKTNRILYEYNYLVAKLGVEMFRQKFKDQNKVVFRMEKYNRTAKVIPDVLSAGGSYEFCEDTFTITYKQETVMDRKINSIYTMFIKRDVQAYLKEIMRYIDEWVKKN